MSIQRVQHTLGDIVRQETCQWHGNTQLLSAIHKKEIGNGWAAVIFEHRVGELLVSAYNSYSYDIVHFTSVVQTPRAGRVILLSSGLSV